MIPLRALPRIFVPGANPNEPIELSPDQWKRLTKVLRLPLGQEIAILPNDGTLIRCTLAHKAADPIEVYTPETEPALNVTLAQALPKGDKLDEIVRACTSIGVSRFALFPSVRTVVRWDAEKFVEKQRRIHAVIEEACEVSFRTRIPEIEILPNLKAVLQKFPNSMVLSELENESQYLSHDPTTEEQVLIVGPEGGWAPDEVSLIGNRGRTMGPRVLRVEHAGPAAASILLLNKNQ